MAVNSVETIYRQVLTFSEKLENNDFSDEDAQEALLKKLSNAFEADADAAKESMLSRYTIITYTYT